MSSTATGRAATITASTGVNSRLIPTRKKRRLCTLGAVGGKVLVILGVTYVLFVITISMVHIQFGQDSHSTSVKVSLNTFHLDPKGHIEGELRTSQVPPSKTSGVAELSTPENRKRADRDLGNEAFPLEATGSSLEGKGVMTQTPESTEDVHTKWLGKGSVGFLLFGAPAINLPDGAEDVAHVVHKMADLTSEQKEALSDEDISYERENERCSRYSLTYDGRTTRRRVFWGGLIADESFHLIHATSIEAYNVYHSVAFVESNTTQSLTPRKLRFPSGSNRLKKLQAMFGPKTQVTVDYYVDGPSTRLAGVKGLHREHVQRQGVLERWKRNGMQVDDLGLLGDSDEVFTRDFLRALQICEVPEFRPGQDCKDPKIVARTLKFEASPECVADGKPWHHPDIMLGECVDLIGNVSLHRPAKRVVKEEYSWRENGYGPPDHDYSKYLRSIPDGSSMYPLWNGADYRRLGGERQTNRRKYHTGFHFHNFFDSYAEIRRKFDTYGHPLKGATSLPLTMIHDDMSLVVSCAHGWQNQGQRKWLLAGFHGIEGPRPIYFENPVVRMKLHNKMKTIVLEDEHVFGMTNATCIGNHCNRTNYSSRSLGVNETNARQNERNSSDATVIAMGIGYDVGTYKSFVGSLRNANYEGHIIIGVAPDIDEKAERYLFQQNVLMHKLKWVNCTFEPYERNDVQFCAYPYSDIKTRWSRFPLAADWLKKCNTCTGSVLFSDMRDAYFQRDPFGPDTPEIQGLQVFEEHPALDTTNWLTDWPIKECKGKQFQKPMLCSGTTIGTRDSMLAYLDAMYHEMKTWIRNPKCRFKINGDDQSIHNYLFYDGKLPFAKSIPHRTGIVNTIGHEAAQLRNKNNKRCDEEGITHCKYWGANFSKNLWIGLNFNLTDSKGWLTNLDGTRSCVIHQYDRLGSPFLGWLRKQPFMQDRLKPAAHRSS